MNHWLCYTLEKGDFIWTKSMIFRNEEPLTLKPLKNHFQDITGIWRWANYTSSYNMNSLYYRQKLTMAYGSSYLENNRVNLSLLHFLSCQAICHLYRWSLSMRCNAWSVYDRWTFHSLKNIFEKLVSLRNSSKSAKWHIPAFQSYYT